MNRIETNPPRRPYAIQGENFTPIRPLDHRFASSIYIKSEQNGSCDCIFHCFQTIWGALVSIFQTIFCCCGKKTIEEKEVPLTEEGIRNFLQTTTQKADLFIAQYLGLETWESEGKQDLARKKMIQCFKGQETILCLNILGLSSLPPGMGKLTWLRVLHASSNQLTALPEELCQLTALRELHLDSNQFKVLPAWIGKLTELQVLDCTQNRLTAIPNEVGQLLKLQMLNCRYNKLTTLPLTLVSLTGAKFDFYANEIATLPEELNTLPINLKAQRLLKLDLPIEPVQPVVASFKQRKRALSERLIAGPRLSSRSVNVGGSVSTPTTPIKIKSSKSFRHSLSPEKSSREVKKFHRSSTKTESPKDSITT
jgi:Leucine-rich repeat (LRR) protein